MNNLFLMKDLTNVYTALIMSLCNNNSKKSKFLDILKAEEKLISMEQKGMRITPGILALFVSSWCKVGEPQRAEILIWDSGLTISTQELTCLRIRFATSWFHEPNVSSLDSTAAEDPRLGRTSRLQPITTPLVEISSPAADVNQMSRSQSGRCAVNTSMSQVCNP